jgi:hypothetical protein
MAIKAPIKVTLTWNNPESLLTIKVGKRSTQRSYFKQLLPTDIDTGYELSGLIAGLEPMARGMTLVYDSSLWTDLTKYNEPVTLWCVDNASDKYRNQIW